MERFVKIVNMWRPLFIFAKRSILDIWQVSEYPSDNFLLNKHFVRKLLLWTWLIFYDDLVMSLILLKLEKIAVNASALISKVDFLQGRNVKTTPEQKKL